jgi:membrane protein
MIVSYLKALGQNLMEFPWKRCALIVFERFREDRLAQTAGSLTFTTSIALVPLFTVVLAAFTIFPIFGQFQAGIQRWLVESLMPESISRQVLGYLTQFSSKASRLGVAGFAALVFSAIALVLTIDHTLNAIWRVRTHRSWIKRMVLYWTAMTLGPLVVALGLFLMSLVFSFTGGETLPLFTLVWRPLLSLTEFILLVSCISALYRFTPNTQVASNHALLGGLAAGVALEGARTLLTLYLGKMSTFSVVYGAFATVPILLVWIYTLWVIVLVGAVWVSCLPALLQESVRVGSGPGWRFQLAVECLQILYMYQQNNSKGLNLNAMAKHLQVDPLELEDVVERLVGMDWIGLLDEEKEGQNSRYVLLAMPQQARLSPLLSCFLLAPSEETKAIWLRFEGLRLDTLLQ